MAVSWVVALKRPGGLAPELPAGHRWWPGFISRWPACRASPRRGSKEARAPALLLGMPAAVAWSGANGGSALMAEVMIGIDPHKSSHTAVAIGAGEERQGELRVRACPSQAGQLLAWA